MTLYARQIVLRNCGRFTVVQSDFGADYRTHTHVTSEALYASLTRGVTWRPKPIVVNKDSYDFAHDYDLAALPIWFTPGLFLDLANSYRLPHDAFDTAYFNVLHEAYPTTSKSYEYKRSGEVKQHDNRPHHIPTYGTWQSIKPDYRMTTYAFSHDVVLLENFKVGQTYLLGKKRTMMQITVVTDAIKGQLQDGAQMTPFLQVPPMDIVNRFQSFEMLTGTLRYAIVRGVSRPDTQHYHFSDELNLPIFAIPHHISGHP